MPFHYSQSIKKENLDAGAIIVSWWPLKKKEKKVHDNLHIKGTKFWLQDLRELCEINFDNYVEGQRLIRQMQVEWTDSHQKGDVSNELLA